MDDLMDNFADQNIESPTEDEEVYKYHFINGSPAASEHERSIPAFPAMPSDHDPFFDIEAADSHQATGGRNEDEGDYNADIDEDDDEPGYERVAGFHKDPTSALSYNEKLDDFDGSFPNQDYFEGRLVNSGATNVVAYPSLAPSDDDQESDHGFSQHLLRLHRQDSERDELLARLHQENVDLKKALKECIPGSNRRAEAAERNYFEIRKNLDIKPYICVLIDLNGYKIHEDLLQAGKKGGIEAADRLCHEVLNYLQSFSEAQKWEIMVHLYIDIGGLLARCIGNIPLISESSLRGFMLGFTEAQPLFTTVDVGRDPEKLLQKMTAMLHLFAENNQCKHLILGCSHNGAYRVALEKYACNPIAASSISLLKSYEANTFFEGLPFDSVKFPHLFRSTPYKKTDKLAEDMDYTQNLAQQPGSDRITREIETSSINEGAGKHEAIAKWQATAAVAIPVRVPARPPARNRSGWASEKNVLLNVNDERVDHKLCEIDDEISESMLDRMEMRRFCLFYHLQNSCSATLFGKPCRFRHGPRLSDAELRFLKRDARGLPCNFGSRCRRADCIYGHVCPDQPGCKRGSNCLLYQFHGVDKTAVKIFSSEKTLSPRKGGSRV